MQKIFGMKYNYVSYKLVIRQNEISPIFENLIEE